MLLYPALGFGKGDFWNEKILYIFCSLHYQNILRFPVILAHQVRYPETCSCKLVERIPGAGKEYRISLNYISPD